MTTALPATLATLVREFDRPLSDTAGLLNADSELSRYGHGFQIVTLAEHRLAASHRTLIHRQTLEALEAGNMNAEAFIREHVMDAHFKTFGDALRGAVEASTLAWEQVLKAFNEGRTNG